MMSLTVTMTALRDPYEDKEERIAATKYFKSRKFEMQHNEREAGIDLSGSHNGIIYAIEVAYTKLWPDGSVDPATLPFLSIPKRKWRHFKRALIHTESVVTYHKGLYFLLSSDRTHAAIFDMKNLLDMDLNTADIGWLFINGSSVEMVRIPVNMIKRYVKIP